MSDLYARFHPDATYEDEFVVVLVAPLKLLTPLSLDVVRIYEAMGGHFGGIIHERRCIV